MDQDSYAKHADSHQQDNISNDDAMIIDTGEKGMLNSHTSTKQ